VIASFLAMTMGKEACYERYSNLLALMVTASAKRSEVIERTAGGSFHQENAEVVLKEKFGIDTDQYGLSFMVAFGYRKEAPAHEKSRRSFEDVVTWK